jgi:homoserine dehydrogenase
MALLRDGGPGVQSVDIGFRHDEETVSADTAGDAASKPARIAMLGFGTVGRSVAKLLLSQHQARLRITHICNRRISSKRVGWMPSDVVWTEDVEEVLASDVEILVELIGGVTPAEHYVRRALESGKSVVTANKQLVARYGPALIELARVRGVQIRFEASVAGGIPVLRAIQEGLSGDRLFRIAGVLNGTCTYVLSRMEQGVAFDDALGEARRHGFAEADPTDDIDGHDAAAKLAILSAVALRRPITASDVSCRSISAVEPVDVRYAQGLGCAIRQVAWVESLDADARRILAFVRPALVSHRSSLSRVEGSQNVVTVRGEFGGETGFFGSGAGGDPTAVAVVSDLLSLAHGPARPGQTTVDDGRCEVTSDFVSPYYVRFTVEDRPGIIASVAAAFSRHGINIDAVVQQPGWPKSRLPFVITLERCAETRLDAALDEIRRLDFHAQPPLSLPMLFSLDGSEEAGVHPEGHRPWKKP